MLNQIVRGIKSEELIELQNILKLPLNLHKIINHKPQDVYAKLNKILVEGDHKELISKEIETTLPNMVPKQDVNEDKNLVNIFVKTQVLRNSLKTIHNRIEQELEQLANLETRKETQVYANTLRPELNSIQTAYSDIKNLDASQIEKGQLDSSSTLEKLNDSRRNEKRNLVASQRMNQFYGLV